MTAFYERKIDVLISTNIVESGLDIPTANTLIVQRADMFGLSQLYQLRGRIGRSKRAPMPISPRRPRRSSPRPRHGGWKCCNRWISWARASPSPAMTWTSAAPAIFWARSSPAMSAKWASSFTRRCWKRRSRACKEGADGRCRRPVVTHHQSGRLGADPRGLCRRPQCPHVALPPAGGHRDARRHRPLRRRTDRPLRPIAGRGAAPVRDRHDQAVGQAGGRGEDRCRSQGRHHRLPQQCLRQSG